MRLFLHLKLSVEFPSFDSSIKHWVDTVVTDVQYFDIDNHSDTLVVNTAKQAINEAQCIFVWIESTEEQPGTLLSIMKQLAQFEKKKPLKLVIQGSNPVLEKLERGFKQPWIRNVDKSKLEELLRSFFTS